MAKCLTGAAIRQLGHLLDQGTIAGLTESELLERFVGRRDEVAFEAIVRRHGPMVLGVCRSILKDADEVEDAFQAAFLVLIRRAETIRGRDSLGGWLHRVAYRVAIQAQADRSRRRSAETKAAGLAAGTKAVGPEIAASEQRSIIHEELDRLPERFRLPVILCDLNGLSRPEAARRLSLTEGAFCSRLTRARAQLRGRLIRRGLGLSVGSLAPAFEHEVRAAVPPRWVESLARVAAAGGSAEAVATGVISATAARWAATAIKAFAASQLKGLATIGLAIVAFGLIASHTIPAGLVLAGVDPTPVEAAAGPRPAARPAASPAESPVRTKPITFSGRVLDPDGKPFAGAKLVVSSPLLKEPSKLPTRAVSDEDGRFEFSVPISQFDERILGIEAIAPWKFATVLALADGFAFGLDRLTSEDGGLVLHLSRDDLPIEGRIIDLQGKPIAGASIAVRHIQSTEGGNLESWLKMVEERGSYYLGEDSPLTRELPLPTGSPLITPSRSDADGRFVIRGIGRERLVELQVEQSAIETCPVFVRTRPGVTLRFPTTRSPGSQKKTVIHAVSFVHVAPPSRPIEGTVRDHVTGRPLAGIIVFEERRILNHGELPWATSDALGRYRLTGVPRDGAGDIIAATPDEPPYFLMNRLIPGSSDGEALPYLQSRVKVPRQDGPDTGPIRIDFTLDRGIWVTGRAIDKSTGKPAMVSVEYFVKADNPTLKRLRDGRYSPFNPVNQLTRPDGTFRMIALPGRGYLTAQTMDPRYIFGVGAEQIRKEIKNGSVETRPNSLFPKSYNAVVAIDPVEGATTLTRDLFLERGRGVELRVLDPEGNPLSGLTVAGLHGGVPFLEDQDPKAASFTVGGMSSGEKRRVTVRQKARKLVGQIIIDAGTEGPVSLTLQPWGTVTGRIVDAEGEPVDGGNLMTNSFSMDNHLVFGFSISEFGRDGMFRLDGLIPGRPFTYEVGYSPKTPKGGVIFSDLTLKPGETRDLGDVAPVPKKML